MGTAFCQLLHCSPARGDNTPSTSLGIVDRPSALQLDGNGEVVRKNKRRTHARRHQHTRGGTNADVLCTGGFIAPKSLNALKPQREKPGAMLRVTAEAEWFSIRYVLSAINAKAISTPTHCANLTENAQAPCHTRTASSRHAYKSATRIDL